MFTAEKKILKSQRPILNIYLEHVGRNGKSKNAYKILIVKPEGKGSLRSPTRT